ncbi:hypothetical protein JCM6882_005811 [Rhodosporidiobolus microsporus]
MEQHSLNSTTTSPLDWIACSHCHSSPSTSSPLWLTTCTHTVCEACLFPPPAAQPPSADSAPTATCPACGVDGAVIALSAAVEHPEFAHCFKPLGTLVQELGMAAGWQMTKLSDELEFFKAKCAEQKTTLSKVASEVKQLKGVRSQAEKLSAENAFLRSQLAAAHEGHHAAQKQQENAYFPNGGADGSRGMKRKAGRSPDRAALSLYPAPTGAAARAPPRSVSTASELNLPLPPTRLSFTPAQSKMAQERLKVGSRQGGATRGQVQEVEGRTSGGQTVKERLAQFAYNPSRATHRASAAPTPRPTQSYSDPALPPHSRPTSRIPPPQYPDPLSHSQPPFRLDQPFPPRTSPGSSPFFYNPPSTENVPHHQQQQQQRSSPSTSRRYHDEQQQQQQLMPPPPVPSGSRRVQQQQQQQNGGASPFVSARQLQQQQGQEYAQPPGTPASASRTGAYTPAPFAHAHYHPPPPPPSSTPFGTSAGASHRQPFRPAGGSFGGGGGGGSANGSASGSGSGAGMGIGFRFG